MPACPPGSLILVTGASGFIGAHTAKAFLQAGYPIRVTVRSKEKGEYLKKLFQGEKESFEYVLVEDISEAGAFDEAVKGVVGVAHTASPFHRKADDPQEVIRPAVEGTTGILKSIKKNNPECKRVVITSSFACIIQGDKKPPHRFTEEDWNELSVPLVEEKGAAADGISKYRASKILAEKSFWKFIESEKPSFDGVTVNPPLVLGPIIHECSSPDKLNTSVAEIWEWMEGKHKDTSLPAPGGPFVDVRDAAMAHVLGIKVEAAGGQRFLTSPDDIIGNDYCKAIKKLYPELSNVPEPIASPTIHQDTVAKMFTADGAKAEKVLGLKYTTIDQSCEDMARSLHERFIAKT